MGWLFKASPLLANHKCNPPKPEYHYYPCDVPEAGSLWQCDELLCAVVWEVKASTSLDAGYNENMVEWRKYKGPR